MKHMGIDLGSKSCGIAVSDVNGQLVRGLKNLTFAALEYKKLTDQLMTIIESEAVKTVVIGYPLNLDGDETTASKMAKRLKKALGKKTDLPIVLHDERYSSQIAHEIMIEQNLSRKKRKEHLDEMSAVVILNDYLTQERTRHE
jgi:putative Holliday junction resolvase